MNDNAINVDLSKILPLIEERLSRGENAVISGGGTSMYPFINENTDRIVLSPLPFRKIKVGDIYLYRRNNGGYAIHRVCKIRSDGLVMLGDAQTFFEEHIDTNALIAFVSEIIRNDKHISCINGIRHTYAVLRMKFRFWYYWLRWNIKTSISK